MTKSEIQEKLTVIFREIFTNPNIVLSDELTANDVDNWDSLSHMLLIAEIENKFNIKFKLKELNKMKNVGDLMEIVASKLEQ